MKQEAGNNAALIRISDLFKCTCIYSERLFLASQCCDACFVSGGFSPRFSRSDFKSTDPGADSEAVTHKHNLHTMLFNSSSFFYLLSVFVS